MTELLRRALAEIERLPADTQDAVATRILADLADEQAWAARFEATSPEQWNRLAEMARREIAAGDTIPLEDAFPVKVTEDPIRAARGSTHGLSRRLLEERRRERARN